MSTFINAIRLSGNIPQALLYAGSGAIVFALTSWLHVSLFGRRALEKFPPDWTEQGALRAAGCLTAGLLVAFALRRLTGPMRATGLDELSRPVVNATAIATLALLVFTTLVMGSAPQTMIDYVAELQPLGLLQEGMIALACVLVAFAALRMRSSQLGRLGPLSGTVIVAAMSLTLFVLLMEETSYGQHYLGWATPERFAGNIQNETNLHNFYTYRFELIFYSAAMLVFVIAPVAWPDRHPSFLDGLSFYIPPRIFAVLALPVCGFLYNGWNIVPLQVGFFMAVALGLMMAIDQWPHARRAALLSAVVVALLVVAQGTIFWAGHLLTEHYETDEIRESHIALLCLAYAGWLFLKASAPTTRV